MFLIISPVFLSLILLFFANSEPHKGEHNAVGHRISKGHHHNGTQGYHHNSTSHHHHKATVNKHNSTGHHHNATEADGNSTEHHHNATEDANDFIGWTSHYHRGGKCFKVYHRCKMVFFIIRAQITYSFSRLGALTFTYGIGILRMRILKK